MKPSRAGARRDLPPRLGELLRPVRSPQRGRPAGLDERVRGDDASRQRSIIRTTFARRNDRGPPVTKYTRPGRGHRSQRQHGPLGAELLKEPYERVDDDDVAIAMASTSSSERPAMVAPSNQMTGLWNWPTRSRGATRPSLRSGSAPGEGTKRSPRSVPSRRRSRLTWSCVARLPSYRALPVRLSRRRDYGSPSRPACVAAAA